MGGREAEWMGGWIGGWVEERTGGPNARVARARGRGRPAAGGPNAWAAQAGEHGRMYLAGRAGCPNAWAAQAGERGRQGERAVGARRRFHRRALPAPGPRVATLSAGRQARGRGGGRGVGKINIRKHKRLWRHSKCFQERGFRNICSMWGGGGREGEGGQAGGRARARRTALSFQPSGSVLQDFTGPESHGSSRTGIRDTVQAPKAMREAHQPTAIRGSLMAFGARSVVAVAACLCFLHPAPKLSLEPPLSITELPSLYLEFPEASDQLTRASVLQQAEYSMTLQAPKAMVAAELAFGTLSTLRKP